MCQTQNLSLAYAVGEVNFNFALKCKYDKTTGHSLHLSLAASFCARVYYARIYCFSQSESSEVQSWQICDRYERLQPNSDSAHSGLFS
jgi:hypothetical protein